MLSNRSPRAQYHMRRIRQLRHLLDSPSLLSLVVAFVFGRLDYCNSVYTLAARRLFCRDFDECRAQLQGRWLEQDDWSLPCRSCGIFTGFLYRVGYDTSYVRWCTTSCMVPRLATSGICVVRVEICDCDRVLAGTMSFHSADFPWHRRRSVFPAQWPGTHYRVTFAMPLLEQCLRTDLNPVFQTCIFLKSIYTDTFVCL